MIEGPEIITLFFNGILLSIFWTTFRKFNLEVPFAMHLFLLLILLANFCTVIESFIWENFFNHIEHLCYFLSFIALLLALNKYRKSAN